MTTPQVETAMPASPAAPSAKPSPAAKAASAIARSRARAASHAASAVAAFDSAREQAERVAAHPHAQKAIAVGKGQIGRLRVALGHSETVMAAEQATGVDRVSIVAGAVALFILLVPFNLFGFAQATTSALTLLLPAYKACVVLERDGPTDNLLAYFVILGYFQMLETFVLRLLVSQIPRYYTFKLIFMLYLAHPRTNGAIKVYNLLFSRKLKSPPASPFDETVMTPNGVRSPAFGSPLSPTSPSQVSGTYAPLSPEDDVLLAGGFQAVPTRIPRPAGKFD